MEFQEIRDFLYKLKYQIALKHPVNKADLFVEFLKQERELTDRLKAFEEFTKGSFKEELEGTK